jgi:dTDP-4-amino-4,6-dideoxygalactose transaminase
MEPYRTLYPEQLARLPETDGLCQGTLILPTGTAVGEEDVRRVCEVIRRSVGR